MFTATRFQSLRRLACAIAVLAASLISATLARAGVVLTSGEIVLSVRDHGTTSVVLLNNGSLTPIASGDKLTAVTDLAVAPGGGAIFVTDTNSGLVRIDSATGTQHVVASGGSLVSPKALLLQGNSALVATDQNGILRVNLGTGAQANASDVKAVHLVAEPGGTILAATDMEAETSPPAQGIARLNGQTAALQTTLVPPEEGTDVRALGESPNGSSIVAAFNSSEGGGAESDLFFHIDPQTGAKSDMRMLFGTDEKTSVVTDLVVVADGSVVAPFISELDNPELIGHFRLENNGQVEPLFSRPHDDNFRLGQIAIVQPGASSIPLPPALVPGTATLLLLLIGIRRGGRRLSLPPRG